MSATGAGAPTGRRRDGRAPLQTQVHYLSDNLSIVEETRDISARGLFIASDLLDAVGTRAQVHLYLPGRPEVLVVECVVRWTTLDSGGLGGNGRSESGMGLEITDRDSRFGEQLSRAFAVGSRAGAVSGGGLPDGLAGLCTTGSEGTA